MVTEMRPTSSRNSLTSDEASEAISTNHRRISHPYLPDRFPEMPTHQSRPLHDNAYLLKPTPKSPLPQSRSKSTPPIVPSRNEDTIIYTHTRPGPMTADYLPVAPDPASVAQSPPKKKAARVALDASGQIVEYAHVQACGAFGSACQEPERYDIATPEIRGDSTSLHLHHKKIKRCQWCSNEISHDATEPYCDLCVEWYNNHTRAFQDQIAALQTEADKVKLEFKKLREYGQTRE